MFKCQERRETCEDLLIGKIFYTWLMDLTFDHSSHAQV